MAPSHPPALFVADALGLDFLNSIATSTDTTIDWIDDGDGLLGWLEQARLVPPEALTVFRTQAMPGEFDRVVAQARSLREWFRAFAQSHKGQPLARKALSELRPLNRLLERDEGYSRIIDQGAADTAFEFASMRRWHSPESLLLPIGEALAKFVCTEDFSDLKACEGPQCTLMFADHTRKRGRRWCSMALCGNRAKQAAHRQRLKEVDPEESRDGCRWALRPHATDDHAE